MNFISNWKQEWLPNPKANLLSGITVALALIPETLAFSIIAGVSPMVGLITSCMIAIIISIAGGRPAMISAATGALALLMVGLVRDHGVEYLFAATILTGVIQLVIGYLKLGNLIRFVPHSVMNGFVNALAIMIFMAQLVHFQGQGWTMYALVGLSLLIVFGLPRLTKKFPSALAAIIVVSAAVLLFKLDVKTVGDVANFSGTLPVFHLPDFVPNLDNLMIILPYSLSMALVGLLESLLTANILDEITDTPSSKNREVKGQGLANLATGFFGGMAGCAMIGQSVINVRSGGRTRLSTLTAGVVLLLLILFLSPAVKEIPMAALVGVMFMVAIGSFNWRSIGEMRRAPIGDSLVMVVTVAVVLYTHNLGLGVIVGVLLSAVVFARRISRLKVESRFHEDGSIAYNVTGQLFFATAADFSEAFDPARDPDRITVDFTRSHVWDHSGVNAIARMRGKYAVAGKSVTITGLNRESGELVEKLGLESYGTL
ncbi:SulP family inorganic anion transporter [Paenibacillus pasadenensis]|uniref:SulP family inorganic anion transporter n=1 Tax=Paenibacillus pasadenensis TaxID=217090 RepID=UPI002041993E|nr:SulP family inorganic anion transporter [Paenibacillus pasadenensis]MCM3749973.1 SulP family inorganic anion transporter [Paenibacillus pasadenensis]